MSSRLLDLPARKYGRTPAKASNKIRLARRKEFSYNEYGFSRALNGVLQVDIWADGYFLRVAVDCE